METIIPSRRDIAARIGGIASLAGPDDPRLHGLRQLLRAAKVAKIIDEHLPHLTEELRVALAAKLLPARRNESTRDSL